VFSGTIGHFEFMRAPADYWLPTTAYAPHFPVFWGPIDLALSVAADVVILPYTLCEQLVYGNVREETWIPMATPCWRRPTSAVPCTQFVAL
jgi:hypothetical protein